MSLSNVVKVMPGTGLRVAAGVTFFGGPVAFSASGADTTAVFKAVPAKDVFSTQSLEAAHGKVFITGEWNHWGNGSVCTTPVSPQCSVSLWPTRPPFQMLNSRVLWGGTDEPGVDARYGAFPHADDMVRVRWHVAVECRRRIRRKPARGMPFRRVAFPADWR